MNNNRIIIHQALCQSSAVACGGCANYESSRLVRTFAVKLALGRRLCKSVGDPLFFPNVAVVTDTEEAGERFAMSRVMKTLGVAEWPRKRLRVVSVRQRGKIDAHVAEVVKQLKAFDTQVVAVPYFTAFCDPADSSSHRVIDVVRELRHNGMAVIYSTPNFKDGSELEVEDDELREVDPYFRNADLSLFVHGGRLTRIYNSLVHSHKVTEPCVDNRYGVFMPEEVAE